MLIIFLKLQLACLKLIPYMIEKNVHIKEMNLELLHMIR